MTLCEITEALRRSELFETLDEKEIHPIAALCQLETYETGQTIFEQGQYGNKLYLIIEGQVVLQRSVNLGARQATLTIGRLGKGRALGWSALLHEPRIATASTVCQKPTQVISLEGVDIRSTLERDPQAGFKVMRRLAYMLGDRLRSAYSAMDTQL
jgi:CRP/FNR family transcriptional regulator